MGEAGRRYGDERYSRQIRFAPIGHAGQRRLGESAVLIVGAGALGASLAQHLTRAGVGEIRLADRDYVEPSNLQRQMLFDESDAEAALPKAAAAAAKLRRINGEVSVVPYVTDVNSRTVGPLIDGADLVLDGTDNAATRLLLSDECFRRGIPLLYGGVTGSAGMCATLLPGRTACLRCLIGGEEAEEGETCDTAGVISPAVDLVASLQAAEALKLLTGNEDALRNTWISADLWPFRLRESQLPAGNGRCPHCSPGRGAERGQRLEAERRSATTAAAPVPGGPANAGHAEGEGRSASDAQARRPGSGAAAAGYAAGTVPMRQSGGAAASAGYAPERAFGRTNGSGAPAPLQAVTLCGRDTVQLTLAAPLPLEAARTELERKGCRLTANPYLLRAELPVGQRLVLFPDGRVLVQGTTDAGEAAALCGAYLDLDKIFAGTPAEPCG
ncbi:ThiF family adenylyltransferase [Paenibacillus thailandensis]|uniref:ThiF family adenylyltransferase n=1 Tax=Paenibacillus thailandensis TaxID=393250 RepID=A0ABW5QT59_9BACL